MIIISVILLITLLITASKYFMIKIEYANYQNVVRPLLRESSETFKECAVTIKNLKEQLEESVHIHFITKNFIKRGLDESLPKEEQQSNAIAACKLVSSVLKEKNLI